MMTIGTIGIDGIAGSVAVIAGIGGTLATHILWVVAALRYRGLARKTVNSLFGLYLTVPFLVGAAYAVSIHAKPLVNCPEPFGGDMRPIGYIVAWIVVGAAVAFAGIVVIAMQADWGRKTSKAEQCALPPAPAGPSEGAR
jgi:hypothetical protein